MMAKFDMSNTHGMQAHCLHCDTPTVEMTMRMKSSSLPQLIEDEEYGVALSVGFVEFEQEVHCRRCKRSLTDDEIIWRTPDGTQRQ